MKFLVKYGIGFYLLVSLLYKLNFIVSLTFTNAIFYALMAIGIAVIPLYYKVLYSRKSLKVFWLLHFINFINLIYLLIFNFQNTKSWLYFLSKYATFNLIILGLIYNYNFYKNWITRNLKYLLLLILALGIIYGGQSEAEARLSIGFNPNDLGILGVLGFFSIVFLKEKWQKNAVQIFFVILFLIAVLLSGSRAALLAIGLVVLLTYGINYRTVGLALLFAIGVYISGNFGYTTGLDRLSQEKSVFSNRDVVFKKGLLTFYDAFWFGNGLDKYGWSNPKYFRRNEPILGPHNAYIALAIMYGIVFSSFFLLALLRFVIKSMKILSKHSDKFGRFAFYYLLIVLFDGFVESLIIGINEFETLLFWFFIGVVAICPQLSSEDEHQIENLENNNKRKIYGLTSVK